MSLFGVYQNQGGQATTGASVLDSWYMCTITYSSEDLVDLYFIPHYSTTNYTYPGYELRVPESKYFNVYSTRGYQQFDYDSGYKDGYNKARENQSGLLANAESSGYHQGYSEGIQRANEYTFIGLLGSVVDAPLTAIFGKIDPVTNERVGGLFNVTILGVDMTAFFSALLSLMLIIAVIRIALKVVT